MRNRLPDGSGSAASPRRITFCEKPPFHSGGISGSAWKIRLLAKSFSNRWYTMTFGATTRKLVDRSEPGTRCRWKRDQTTAIAITQVLPAPVAILKAKRRRFSGRRSCTPSRSSSGR